MKPSGFAGFTAYLIRSANLPVKLRSRLITHFLKRENIFLCWRLIIHTHIYYHKKKNERENSGRRSQADIIFNELLECFLNKLLEKLIFPPV